MIRTLSRLPSKYGASFLMYALLGGSCALVEWAVFYGANRIADLHYITASIFGFLVATAVNYVLSSRFGFRSSGRSALSTIALIYVASLIGLGINLLTMVCLIEWAGMNSLVSKILGTGNAFGWNYAVRQFLIFSTQPRWSEGGGPADVDVRSEPV